MISQVWWIKDVNENFEHLYGKSRWQVILSLCVSLRRNNMKKITPIFCLLLFSYAALAMQSLELVISIDKGLSFTGRNGSYLGEVVSYIGDVNNDGYDDWAIGLPYAATYETGVRNGKVYLYYGNSDIPNNKDPYFILVGEKENDRFGEYVTNAGDVNNDGYSDIMITCSRCVTIYYGGNQMDSEPDVIFIKENEYGFFGVSVSTAGDVNSDGYDDVVIGSKNYAYIYYGGDGMDSNVDVILIGESERDYFGFCVSNAGDVNQDGYDDVFIGAQGYYAGGYDAGRAYIYYGSSNMDSTADIILSGENAGDYFGEIVSYAGDVNNDGYADVIVSAPRNDSKSEDAGRVYIYYGDDLMDTIADVVVDGKITDSFFGQFIGSAGDINKDSFNDVLIGTSENISIFLGDSLMDNIADIVLVSDFISGSSISSITCKGDYNNDGFTDVITGQPHNDTNGENAGCVSLYYGDLQMDTTADAVFYGEPGMDYFGSSVSYAGDLNNDGYDDVIIGAPMEDSSGPDAGCAYIYYGGQRMDANADVILVGNISYGHWGHCVSYAGDVNHDGFSDVIVGGFNTGYVHIYLGKDVMDNSADFTFSSGKFGDNFGECVASAGDINQDGYDDVIIGASCDNTKGTHTGCVYIHFGGYSMDTNPALTLIGETEFNNFGESVACAGDINNDGYSDLMVGAPGNEAGGDRAGRVYIYYSNPSIDPEPDVVITGNPHQWLGSYIAHAGDVNNDGYDDIVIGAPYFGASLGGVSYVYIYYGGTNMDANADVVIEKKNWLGFGADVSYAGDLNNDDYADIMIGDGSRVFIYYGGCEMDTIPDIILISEARSNGFGNSLSIAGDVNNDGYSELIIGAPYHFAVGSNMGRAYIYSSKEDSSDPTTDNIEKEYKLYHNYPNPFNPKTTISFSLPVQSHVELKIYTITGQEIATLVNEHKLAGIHSVEWNSNNKSGNTVPSGLYLYCIKAGNFVKTYKMIFLK